MTDVRIEPTFDAWRDAARHLLMQHVPPGRVHWVESAVVHSTRGIGTVRGEVDGMSVPRVAKRAGIRVPRAFVSLAERVACHRETARWGLMYRVLWRLATSEPDLLQDPADPDIRRLGFLAEQVDRDVEAMREQVRFKKLRETGPGDTVRERFVAWYAPAHRIVPLVAPHFVDRFGSLDWAILTPDACVFFDGVRAQFGPGVDRASGDDDVESLWKTYAASQAVPASVPPLPPKPVARQYWKNMS